MRRAVIWSSPVVYVVTLVLVAFGSLSVSLGGSPSMSAFMFVFTLWILPFLLIGATFGILGWVFVRIEGPRRPTISGHLRRCALLYSASLLLLFVLFRAKYYDMIEGGHALFLIAIVYIACAILVDALVVLIARRRSGRVGSGATA